MLHAWALSKIGKPCRFFILSNHETLQDVPLSREHLAALVLEERAEYLETYAYRDFIGGILGIPGTSVFLGDELAFVEIDPSLPLEKSAFTEALDELLDAPIIPYDPAERRAKFPGAFAKLEKYLKRWEPENLTGWRLDIVRWFRGEPVGEE